MNSSIHPSIICAVLRTVGCSNAYSLALGEDTQGHFLVCEAADKPDGLDSKLSTEGALIVLWS